MATNKLRIRQINFQYGKELVEIFYMDSKERHYIHVTTFTVWAEHNYFNEDDLVNLLTIK